MFNEAERSRPVDAPDREAVRAQLDSILRSDQFVRAARLRQFLEFVVTESLDGRSDELTEQPIAWQLYGRGDNSDQPADSAVRVDAYRLRNKLREYYVEHSEAPVVIDLPKGGYVPVFEIRAGDPTPPHSREPPDSRTVIPWIAGFVALAGIAVLYLILTQGKTESSKSDQLDLVSRDPSAARVPAAFSARPLTTTRGHEIESSLSPDGAQVSYAGASVDDPNSDIYVRVIGEDQSLQLTDTPFPERIPAWSPDGRWIAFIRQPSPGVSELLLIPPVGGVERHVINGALDVAWMPTGDKLLVIIQREDTGQHALVALSIADQKIDVLHEAQRLAVLESPSASPDGRTVTFIQCHTPARRDCDLFGLSLDAGKSAQRLTNLSRPIAGQVWTPDGTQVVLSLAGMLHRAVMQGLHDVAVESIGIRGSNPALVPWADGARLVFQRGFDDPSIVRMDIEGTPESDDRRLKKPRVILDSTRNENNPVVSPDGEQIAFVSDRGGAFALWMSDDEGRNPRLITEAILGQLRWSPDGQWIGGLCQGAGTDGDDICIASASTGAHFRVAPSQAVEAMPIWSADGRILYFVSTRTGEVRIWISDLQGERLEPVSNFPAIIGHASLDGRVIYYYSDPTLSTQNWVQPLWSLEPNTGKTTKVVEKTYPFALATSKTGLYWLDFRPGREKPPVLRYRNDTTGEEKELGPLAHSVYGTFPELGVDPDDRFILYTAVGPANTDLYIIDNFQ